MYDNKRQQLELYYTRRDPMKRNGSTLALAFALTWSLAAMCPAQAPELPKPTKEHELLGQFSGEWDATAETVPRPGQPAMKCQGVESAKMLGGFWLIGRNEATMMGAPVSSVLSIGFDPASKKYVGTFVCSMDSNFWKYEGTMEESGKKLTLETEGPSPLDPKKRAKFQEVLELKDKDNKAFTSYIQGDDGKWVKMVTVDYRRKK
jgi:hypothetical protein